MSLRIIFELIKPRITIASTITSAVGYTMARGQFDLNIIPLLIGGFLLACGAAALNQIQEADIDKLVKRTAQRPIPSGQISSRKALIVSISLLLIGLFMFLFYYDWLVALLGVVAVIVYNGIYTPLKKITPFAVIPGALVGAIPPLSGWIAAEGHLVDPRIYYLCFFYFIWQIPHFWLLLLLFSDQFKQNNLPSLFDKFSNYRVQQLTFSAVAATAIIGVLLPYYLILMPVTISYIISLSGIIIFIRAFSLLSRKQFNSDASHILYRRRFIDINIYALIVTLLIIEANVI